MPYQCENNKCQKRFAHNQSRLLHQRHCKGNAPLECGFEGCQQVFSTLSARKEHKTAKHSNTIRQCSCGKIYQWRPSMARHKKVTGHL
jgi:hypothetical protein